MSRSVLPYETTLCETIIPKISAADNGLMGLVSLGYYATILTIILTIIPFPHVRVSSSGSQRVYPGFMITKQPSEKLLRL